MLLQVLKNRVEFFDWPHIKNQIYLQIKRTKQIYQMFQNLLKNFKISN
jgi:hypothetical protein